MIPADLAAFRALMTRAAKFMHDEEWKDEHADDSRVLYALATATPAQLCGIVGTVTEHTELVPVSGAHYEDNGTITITSPGAVFMNKPIGYIVTPREGEG